MLVNNYAIEEWCQGYLDFYGPAKMNWMNVEETNTELLRIFRPDDTADEAVLLEDWADTYMQVFEELYGNLGIISALDVEEINREYIRCFRKDEEAEVLLKRAA